MRIVKAFCLALVLPWCAVAQDLASEDHLSADLKGLLDALPEQTLRKLRKGPDFFVEHAAGVILGYGRDGAIDRKGLETYVAVRRAQARARAMRPFLMADLDNDLAVTEAELAIQLTVVSASRRGRMLLNFRAADQNSDGRATFEELRLYAEDRALHSYDDVDAKSIFSLMEFDTDGDGFVTLDEVAITARALFL